MVEKELNNLFKPVPLNDDGKPIKGYSIFLEGELPKFLTQKQTLPKYKIIRPDGTTLAVVPTSFRNDIKQEFITLGYQFTPVVEETIVPVKSIAGVRVKISNTNWKLKYAITINKGNINEIIRNTSKVLKILLDNKVNINRENICPSYCGIPIENEEDIDMIMAYKR